MAEKKVFKKAVRTSLIEVRAINIVRHYEVPTNQQKLQSSAKNIFREIKRYDEMLTRSGGEKWVISLFHETY